jgi:hypothetical protein
MKRPNVRKRESPPPAARRYVSIKIADDVRRKLRTVAAWKGVDMSQYLSALVEPILDRELAGMGKQLAKTSRRKPQ